MALNSTSASPWPAASATAKPTISRVMARTSSGVFLIWYFMWMALVEMNVWMRGTAAPLTASQHTRTSCSMARARPQMRAPSTCLAIAATAAKSPFEAMGKPASMTSTPRRAN